MDYAKTADQGRYAEAHAAPPQGPGDGRPTAEQVLRDQGLLGNRWPNKTILITGGSAGLGAESARVLHQTGAKVIITGRDTVKVTSVARDISAANPQYPPVEGVMMDNDSLQSVRNGAKEVLRKTGGRLNILMLNAGVVAAPVSKTQDGFEAVFGWNYLAGFLLAQLLAPALVSSSQPEFCSRLIVVSSAGHRASNVKPGRYDLTGENYDGSIAYAQSKTGNILMANEFERRYRADGVHALSLNPGLIIETEIGRGMPGTAASRREMYCKADPHIAQWEKSVPQGAATQVWASVAQELEGLGGVYLDDVQVATEAEDGPPRYYLPGWKPWIWEEDTASKLWEDSMAMVGLNG